MKHFVLIAGLYDIVYSRNKGQFLVFTENQRLHSKGYLHFAAQLIFHQHDIPERKLVRFLSDNASLMKKKSIKDKYLHKINPIDPSIYLELENIYCGGRVESIAMENSTIILKKNLQGFHVKTPNFYVTLFKQTFQRFLPSWMLEKLELLEAIDPANMREGTPNSSVV